MAVLLIMALLLGLCVYGFTRLIKWLIQPSYVYKLENHIYVSDKKLTPEEQVRAKKKLEK